MVCQHTAKQEERPSACGASSRRTTRASPRSYSLHRGGKARKSFAQEEGGRRVAQGLVAPRAQVVPTTLPPPEQRGEEEVGEEEETHAATSVWYSVDEFGNFKGGGRRLARRRGKAEDRASVFSGK